jgi:hypothetical protein
LNIIKRFRNKKSKNKRKEKDNRSKKERTIEISRRVK